MCPVFASCMQKMQHRVVQLHSLYADRHFGQMQMVAVPPKLLHCTAAESQESNEETAEPARDLLSYVLAVTAMRPERGRTVLRHSSSPVVSSWHTSSR